MIYSHTVSHEPENQARRYWDEESTPLFPFGFGLSYTRFTYSDLTVDRQELTAGETLTASVTVTNSGERDADEVVQLYLHQRHGSASRPVRELKGFRRVHLRAGESQVVEFPIGPDQLRYWNAAARDFVLDAAAFDVWVGGDSTAALATAFTVAPAAGGA
jgi:beta-glucosidase